MRALFIGGTGTISAAIVRRLVKELNWEVWLINRGNRMEAVPAGVRLIAADINDEALVLQKLGDMTFDVVGEFIGFTRDQVERDYRLFKGRTRQYIYTSSASAYHKPVASHVITEGTALANPYWAYSRNKIACEDFLFGKYRQEGFPVTVIRPSHTYGDRSVPVGVHGDNGSWQVLRRMLDGKPVIIHGDGSSQWTLTHNTDFAKGFVGLMGHPKAIGEAFQITSDETLTWDQIHGIIAEALGVELKAYHVASEYLDAAGPYDFLGGLVGDKARTVLFDNSKLKGLVPGLKTEMPFAKGVRRTISHILAHPELQVPDPAFDAWCDRLIDKLEKAKADVLAGD